MTTGTLTWISDYQRWLSEAESLNNAQLVANFFKGTDWVKESIAAMLGNMRHESSINPNMYEYGYDWSEDRGFGLVQWTPRSKYWNWALSMGLDPYSGNSQLARINYEVENNIQWIAKADNFNYLTFAEFRSNARGLTVEQLTEAFTWGYERPNRTAGETSMASRQAFAGKSLSTLDWTGTGGGGVSPTPSGKNPVQQTQYQHAEKETVDGMTYVRVRLGDNLTKIASRYGVDVKGIKRVEFKDIPDQNALIPDEILLLPNKQPAPPTSYPVQYYVVRSGDNLTKIANRYGKTVQWLQAANNLKNPNLIKVGQKLIVNK